MAHEHDDRPQHISGPTLDEDGYLVGEIALPGGLPPDEDDDDQHDLDDDEARFDVPRWDEAFTVTDRDGFVVFDPETPGGFRALTDAEHHDLIDSIRAGAPQAAAGDPGSAPELDAAGPTQPDRHSELRVHQSGYETRPARGSSPPWGEDDEAIAVAYDCGPWTEPTTGRSWDSLGHGARELSEKAARPDSPDDRDEIERRLDAARTRLTGYTWREGVDRGQALAERREQLGRWYGDDDTDQAEPESDSDSADEAVGPGHCLPAVDGGPDPRWHR
jgi:hypothetical protein